MLTQWVLLVGRIEIARSCGYGKSPSAETTLRSDRSKQTDKRKEEKKKLIVF
jgi:hypothetical protein